MKRFLFAVAVVIASLCVCSCEPSVSGDFLYSIEFEDGATGASTSWQLASFGQQKVIDAMKTAGGQHKGTLSFVFNGDRKNLDKVVIDALNKGMSAGEADPNYDALVVFGGSTLVLYCDSDKKGNHKYDENGLVKYDGFEIYRRTYRANKPVE